MIRVYFVLLIFIGSIFAQNSVVQQFSKAFADVAEGAKPAVVTIITDKIMKVPNNDLYFFFNPYMDPNSEREYKTNALGSGVIVDSKNGYILTNNHVVEDMDNIKVKLIDKREYNAEIMGTDPKSDLAILKIEAEDLKELKLGNSDKLRVGEWVMAVGSPFSENLSHTVTTGIVSALGRSNIIRGQSYEDFIQTDAAINPGNSGGALLNMQGELVGINTAIATGGYERSNRGVGFAIPSNMSERIMSDLIDKGYVTRAWLGVYIQEIDSEIAEAFDIDTRNGALITDVVEDSPAENAGIQEGDVIVAFNGKTIANPANLKNVVSLTAPESTNKVELVRDGKTKVMDVVLEELPDSPQKFATKKTNSKKSFGLELRKINKSIKDKYGIDDDDVLVVTGIDTNGEAYAEGIREGDIIKNVGTRRVKTLKEFNKLIEKAEKKGTVLLLVKKPSGGSRFFTLKFN